MEFIQKKTIDPAVIHFLPIASKKEISLIWDRYEGQLPECGFCETGLSCRDCLQGPCISHPFRESNKSGICGKDRDILAIQSLLRLVLKGVMVNLDRLNEFINEVESNQLRPKNRFETNKILTLTRSLFYRGNMFKKEAPKSMIRQWEDASIMTEGIGDIFKASQTLEGGFSDIEKNLIWIFKSSTLGILVQRIYGNLKRSVFGELPPSKIEINLGVLDKQKPNLVVYGYISPIIKEKIAQEAKKEDVRVFIVSGDPIIPPFILPVVTNYCSQEIPLMTGAVDLIISANQGVNPSIKDIAKEYEVPIFSLNGFKKGKTLTSLAKEIVIQAKKSHEFRKSINRDIPQIKESAIIGFSKKDINLKKIFKALDQKEINGVAFLCGSGNVKFTGDQEITSFASEFLKNRVLCFSKGESSIALGKYGYLNPDLNEKFCDKGLSEFLKTLGQVPSVIDIKEGEWIDLLLDLRKIEKNDYKVVVCYPEASRSQEVTEALGIATLGIDVYFWPTLPVIGSQMALDGLLKFCEENLKAKFYIPLEKKVESRSKATMVLRDLTGKGSYGLSGKPWE